MLTKKDIDELRKTFVTKQDFQRAIDQLVELISGGFNRMDKAIERLGDHMMTFSIITNFVLTALRTKLSLNYF